MNLEQEKAARSRILALREEEAKAQSDLEKTQREVREASFSLTNIQERIKDIGKELVGEDEALQRIISLQKDVFALLEQLNELKAEKSELERKSAELNSTLVDAQSDLNASRAEFEAYSKTLSEQKAEKAALVKYIADLSANVTVLEEKKRYFEDSNNELNEHYKQKTALLDLREQEIDKKNKEMANAFADLKVYESRLRREYAIILPDVAYKNPLEGKEIL